MKVNKKNNKASKNFNIDDRQISEDFSEIFDKSENVEDLSTLFIEARVKKGLTQEDVSKILKVRVSVIKQIETGEELKLLGSAYSLGFLRSYAKLVGLEPDDIVKNYKSINHEQNTKFDYNFPGVIKEKKSLFPVISLLIFVFSLVTYSTWYYLNVDSLEQKTANITNLDKINSNLDYVKIEDKLNSPFDNTDKINNDNITVNNEVTSKTVSNENFNKNVNKVNENKKVESKSLIDSDITNETSNIDVTVDSNETSAIANERIPQEEMVLKSSGNSWVEIEDLDGNSYLTRLMRSGETFVVPNKKGLTLSTGNAGVLSLTFGSIYISKLGSIGEVISSRPLNIEAFKER